MNGKYSILRTWRVMKTKNFKNKIGWVMNLMINNMLKRVRLCVFVFQFNCGIHLKNLDLSHSLSNGHKKYRTIISNRNSDLGWWNWRSWNILKCWKKDFQLLADLGVSNPQNDKCLAFRTFWVFSRTDFLEKVLNNQQVYK